MKVGLPTAIKSSLFRAALLLLGLSLPLLAPAAAAQPANDRVYRVLVLYWDNKDFPGNVRFDESFKAELLTHQPERIEYYPEYLETTRFPNQNQIFFHDYLLQKYAGRSIDVVIANADVPLNFLLQYRKDLFPNSPIVFVANHPPAPDLIKAGPGLTGIVHQSTHRETLGLALKLHPDTEQVFVISGSVEHDGRFEKVARQELSGFENTVKITYLTDLSLKELIAKTASLPPRSLILYVWQQALNEEGRLLETYEVLARIAPSSSAPIYGMGSGNLGNGIVGGYLQGPDTNGAKTADLAVRILNGTRAQDIRVESAPTVPAFDWRQLKRWGINEGALPPGSVVRFRVITFWELYKWYVIGVMGVVIIETLLIGWLLLLRARRRQAEEENLRLARLAENQHKRLDEIVSNVPGIVWESVIDPDTNERKTTFISEYLRKMLGYTPEEWLAGSPGLGLRIMNNEDRERATRESEAVIASGKDGISQFRWQGKDGRTVWAESHLSPITEGKEVVGLRGVTLDITKRKLAEETLRQTEEKDRAILRAIPDAMFLQTRDGVYLDYHATNPKDLFAAPDKLLNRNMRDVLPGPLAEEFLRCFQRAEEMGETQILEYQLTINETRRWFEARIVRSGENVLTVLRDITQRVFIEEAIKRNEAQLAGIIGSAMDAIITVDEDQRIMLFNAAAEKIFECSQTEATGQSLDRFIPGPLQLSNAGHIGGIGVKKNPAGRSLGQAGDLYGRKSSGEQFPLEASISQIQLNDQKFYTVILRDVTERKHAIDELRQSEERFSKAFRSNPQPMSLTTMVDGRYLDVNESFLEMSGYTRKEVIGHTSLELGVWESPAERAEFVQQTREQGSAVNVETTFRTKDGSRRFLLSSGELLELDGQQCLLIASSDITERKESEKALRAAHEEVSRLKNQLQEENIYLQEEINLQQDFGEMVGRSDALRHVLFKIEQVARTETTVLITGETGTGKELVARAIHNASARADRPLVKVNCAALSPSLIESEFFGHEKGAFTGASARKIGRFELANGATIFLDEIGELPTELQVKLLRVIQEGEFERLGSSKTIKANVRIIAATNRTLDLEVRQGRFREDLWYRLNVFPITVPPLRQRQEDIPLLVEHFARRFSQKLGKAITSVSPAALRSLRDYSWPGNVRELANVIERAVINSRGPMLRIGEEFVKPGVETSPQTNPSLEELERDYIVRILIETGWRIEGQHGAARILGINPSTLRARMGKLGIQKPGNGLSRSAKSHSD